jgi:hypothetical protein
MPASTRDTDGFAVLLRTGRDALYVLAINMRFFAPHLIKSDYRLPLTITRCIPRKWKLVSTVKYWRLDNIYTCTQGQNAKLAN